MGESFRQAPLSISLPADAPAEKLDRVIRGLEEAGCTLESLGFVVGKMTRGVVVDENGDPREGVKVDARSQAMATRLAADLHGLITRKSEQHVETITRLRLERAHAGTGEALGLTGRHIRQLSESARNEVLGLLGMSQEVPLAIAGSRSSD